MIVGLIIVRSRVKKHHKRRGNLQSELQTCKDGSASKEGDMCVTLTLLSPCVTRRHVVYTMLQSEYYPFCQGNIESFFLLCVKHTFAAGLLY